jgi:hypothetical protein
VTLEVAKRLGFPLFDCIVGACELICSELGPLLGTRRKLGTSEGETVILDVELGSEDTMGYIGVDDGCIDGFLVDVEGVVVGCRLLFDHDWLPGFVTMSSVDRIVRI